MITLNIICHDYENPRPHNHSLKLQVSKMLVLLWTILPSTQRGFFKVPHDFYERWQPRMMYLSGASSMDHLGLYGQTNKRTIQSCFICTQMLIKISIKHYFYNCYFINCNTICTQLLPLVIISPLHNKQDSEHIDVVHEQFLSI